MTIVGTDTTGRSDSVLSGLHLPTFLYIGAAKAGSTWLFEALREHPDVFVPVAKDIQFFDTAYHRGLTWYSSFFRAGSNKRARGELSHNYFTSDTVARRIARDLPGTKLVCCLREPVERTVSAFIHAVALGTASPHDFDEFCGRDSIIRAADYAVNLEPFIRSFPSDDLAVFFYDELAERPDAFIRAVYQHIGVAADFEPECLRRRVLARRSSRFPRLGSMAYTTAQILRRIGFQTLVGSVKRARWFNRSLYRPALSPPSVPEAIVDRLRNRFRPGLDDLEGLIGTPVPASWRDP